MVRRRRRAENPYGLSEDGVYLSPAETARRRRKKIADAIVGGAMVGSLVVHVFLIVRALIPLLRPVFLAVWKLFLPEL